MIVSISESENSDVILKVDITFEYLTASNRNEFVESFKRDVCLSKGSTHCAHRAVMLCCHDCV